MAKNPSWIERIAALDPALVRGLIVTIFGLLAAIFGIIVDDQTIQNVITLVLAVLGIVTGVAVKPAVTPNAKVLAYLPKPYERPNRIEPGAATVPPALAQDVATAATREAV